MFCKNCGTEFKKENKFCTICGNPRPNKSDIPNIHKSASPWLSLKEKFFKSKKDQDKFKAIVTISAVIIVVIILILLFVKSNNKSNNNAQSVVDIICDNGQGGSGTIFTNEGEVLTNNHVIAGSTSCQITIPNPTTGQIAEIYLGTPIIVPTLSEEYDIATIKIEGSYTDKNGKTWGNYPTTFTPFVLPSTCDTKKSSQLGDSVKIYGYPVTSGGYNLTVTDGVISSFADDGSILTSAKVDSGNSGGLAIDQNGCWLGIPSAVVSGKYQNLGVIIPGSFVKQFINDVPAKLNISTISSNNTDTTSQNTPTQPTISPEETNSQICQNSYGTNSEWNGKLNSNGVPSCVCQTGYSWDSTGNSCTNKTSLKQECQNNYGAGSYSYPQGGKAVCGCSSGYTWNSDQTQCVVVQRNGYQVCSNMNATWDGTSYTSSGGFSCTCDTGYTTSSDGNSCVPEPVKTGYQVCSDSFPNETWDGTYSSDGKYNCVCQAGYTYNSYTQSCY